MHTTQFNAAVRAYRDNCPCTYSDATIMGAASSTAISPKNDTRGMCCGYVVGKETLFGDVSIGDASEDTV